ncbi:hypothetical protein [Clostridium sp.]|uniref:hypothetical protein n=1 Tax=Clostridium sp. TaxID=1506 RepID=UPI003216DB20
MENTAIFQTSYDMTMIEQYEEQSDYKNIKISEITKKLEFDIEDYAKELEA